MIWGLVRRSLPLLLAVIAFTPTATARAETPVHRATVQRVIAAAERTHGVQELRRAHPDATRRAPYWNGSEWHVEYYADGKLEVDVTMTVRDRVTGVFTGLKARAQIARRGVGGPFDSPWLFIPLSLLFLAPFFDRRRPFRALHFDLLALLSFGVSYWCLRDGAAGAAIITFSLTLVSLVGRMLWCGLRSRRPRGRLVPHAPLALLVVGLVALAGARIALNVTSHRTFDIALASVQGADRIEHKEPLYVEHSSHLDTYGPLMYAAYVPFELVFPWQGTWDNLPAAHAAAIAFDVLTLLGLVLLGRRPRAGPEGRRLGVALAWAWAAFPFTLLGLIESTNDGLVAMLVVWALVVFFSPAGRGALVGAAAAAKFFPGALLPLLAVGHGERDRRRILTSLAAGVGVAAFAIWLYLPDGGVRVFWDSTLGYQLSRLPDFSVWALTPGLGWLKTALVVLALGLAVIAAVVPRRRSLAQASALGAAVTIALQLAAGHWFYFYIVWFAPLALVALFGAYVREESGPEPKLDAGRLDEQVHLVGVGRAREEHELVGARLLEG
ncbi:MAG TPA: glycosyltransferase 87 family protein [Thermoleophilaceae bacterium]|nr:glycosyltransferase 87 family protein [Thermoleophilaceae bacterium]